MKLRRRLVLASLLTVLAHPLSAQKDKAPESYDVVVYGGVPCGIAAAITAKREGASVLLIEPQGTPNTGDAGGDRTAPDDASLLD